MRLCGSEDIARLLQHSDAALGLSVVLNIFGRLMVWILHTGQPRTMLGTLTDSWQSRMVQQHHCMHSHSMRVVSQILWYHQSFLVQPSLLQQHHVSARPCARWVASLALQQQQLWGVVMGEAWQRLACSWVSSCCVNAFASAFTCALSSVLRTASVSASAVPASLSWQFCIETCRARPLA